MSFTLGVLVGLLAGILLAFALAVIGAFVVKKMLASHETQIQTRMMMLSGTFSTMKIVREMFEQGRFSTEEVDGEEAQVIDVSWLEDYCLRELSKLGNELADLQAKNNRK